MKREIQALPVSTVWRAPDLLRGLDYGGNQPRQPAEHDLLARALATMADAAFITDRTGWIVWVNEPFLRASGYSSAEVIGRTPHFLKSGSQDASFYRELWQTILAGNVWRGEVIERRKDGALYTVDEVITPLRDATGVVTHFMVVLRDITLRKREGEHEHFLAYHDALTGLPNRALFLGVLEQAIANANAARTQRLLALLFLDLDGFKPINDRLGHYVGDRLLVAVAERLRGAVRKSDTVARLGGDEFVVLSIGLGKREIAAALARKMRRSIRQPFVIEGQPIRLSVSIGIAMYPADGESPVDLLRNADQAMYQAKSRGGNSYRFHDPAHTVAPGASR